jgi:hypothetical protein
MRKDNEIMRSKDPVTNEQKEKTKYSASTSTFPLKR